MRPTGRLSMTKQPRSSSTSAAADRPAPDIPVMTMRSSGSRFTVRIVSLPRTHVVESGVHGPADRARQPRDGHQLLLGQGPQGLDRLALPEEPGLAGRPESGDAV